MWAANFFVVSMAFTPEQFNVIVKMVKHVTLAQQAVRTPADPPGLQLEQRGRIDAKCFRAIAFGGGAKEWGDWSFAFKRTVRLCSRDVHILLDFVEKQTMDIQMHLLGGDGDGSLSMKRPSCRRNSTTSCVRWWAKPTPTDIGYAATAEGGEDYSVEDVHAVSPSTGVSNVIGWGHFSRECPSVAHGLAKVARKKPKRPRAKGKVVASWDS